MIKIQIYFLFLFFFFSKQYRTLRVKLSETKHARVYIQWANLYAWQVTVWMKSNKHQGSQRKAIFHFWLHDWIVWFMWFRKIVTFLHPCSLLFSENFIQWPETAIHNGECIDWLDWYDFKILFLKMYPIHQWVRVSILSTGGNCRNYSTDAGLSFNFSYFRLLKIGCQ